MPATADKPTTPANGVHAKTKPNPTKAAAPGPKVKAPIRKNFPSLTPTDRIRIQNLVTQSGDRDLAAKYLHVSKNSLSRILNDKKARVRRATLALIRALPKSGPVEPRKISLGPKRSALTPQVKTPPIFSRLIREIEQAQHPLRDQIARIEDGVKAIRQALGV
jgi:hypothetical protein